MSLEIKEYVGNVPKVETDNSVLNKNNTIKKEGDDMACGTKKGKKTKKGGKK